MRPPFPDSSLGGHASMSSATPGLPLGATAIVYCEGQFGEQDGKTANGLVRHSEKYEILSVIDSSRAGADTGLFLDGTANGIPILASLGEAILHQQPDCFTPVAPPPVRLVADGDAQFGRLGKRIAVVQAAKADEFTVGLNGEVDALGVAVAPALGRAPVEVGEGAG